jgi:hypothetical protein
VQIAVIGFDMKNKTILPLLLILTIIPSAYPQQSGIIEGRLINLTDSSIVARSVELEIIELGGGMSIIKSARTDESGNFRIDGIPTDQRLMVRVNYKGVNYHGQATFNAGRAHVEIGVYEPTTSMKDIRVDSFHMAFQMVGDHLRSLETVTFNNQTKPPRTYSVSDGNFRISKPDGIVELPQIRVTAPGSSMPLSQSALESADGRSYYSLYPLRPGVTAFEVQQLLPYSKKSYTYVTHFYQDVPYVDVGVVPHDVVLSGKGLSKIHSDPQKNFSVYVTGPIKAGTELIWEFSGGTAAPESTAPESTESTEVTAVPNVIGRNALIIGPLLLMGLILVLWYAYNQKGNRAKADFQVRQLRDHREQLLNSIAELDHRYGTHSLGKEEFTKQREEIKRRLRRVSLLLKK